MKLPNLFNALRYVRPVLFGALVTVSAWQALALVREPADAARAHGVFATVSLVIAVRLYVAKRSGLNRVLGTLNERSKP
ncbi:hypothetical protein BTH42_00635 [Burkholderia sp. SRS-W-2-2016]|uniref:hypothetical protein n=1 Tax=Burkholderia sp. SRS-W-2-2016 TaxID=1926878 RepID=UPI00094AD510|nr:hypothetical protein [Burkholderia sp. SRS-W-2-2016]OLL33535.1 hypothetical protein BTH42_00635 [Burkholderia sp. SRS-W-2-2016]